MCCYCFIVDLCGFFVFGCFVVGVSVVGIGCVCGSVMWRVVVSDDGF